MTVIGLDLSLTSTGVAIAKGGRIIETQAIKSSGKKTDGIPETERRLRDIVNRLRAVVDRYNPELAVIEAPSFGSKFGSTDERAGLRWGVIHMLTNRGAVIVQVSPKSRAKYGTGDGNAKKLEVLNAVRGNYANQDLLIRTDDEADALILAAMGSRHLGQPVELVLPDGALESMEKVQWP